MRTVLRVLVFVACAASAASAAVPSPTIEGPVTGGNGAPFVAGTSFDLDKVGYVQEEYFLSGTANAFVPTGPLGEDGRWTVAPGETAPYKTRIVVFRPKERKKFKGTVVVEWLNVTAGLDSAPDWIGAHTEFVREGVVYVGVSAQRLGIEGGPSPIGLDLGLHLKGVDPVRYASLSHPGDSFSYDIFSQAGQALMRPNGPDPLGGLRPKRLIALGESQSAFRFVNYINAIHPLAQVYDGFLVHSRGAFGAPLSEAPQPVIETPGTAQIRRDVRVPVLIFETEADVVLLGYFNARQDDSRHVRIWEVAGTAHADAYTAVVGMTDRGDSPSVADLVLTATLPTGDTCPANINSGPHHWVLKAAVHALERWVRHGKAPRKAPRLDTTIPPLRLVRDEFGNAKGGIRTPQLEVPIATHSGEGQSGSIFCLLFGTTVPFDRAMLNQLYGSHEAYIRAFNRATRGVVRSGYILKPDAKLLKANAAASSIGR